MIAERGKNMKRIIVEVYEGLVSAVYVDGFDEEEFVSIDVLDYDNRNDDSCDKEEREHYDKLAEEAKTMKWVY